jgi:hypothetical protein
MLQMLMVNQVVEVEVAGQGMLLWLLVVVGGVEVQEVEDGVQTLLLMAVVLVGVGVGVEGMGVEDVEVEMQPFEVGGWWCGWGLVVGVEVQ